MSTVTVSGGESRAFVVRAEFLTPVLGTQPSRQVASEFIAKKNGYELTEEEELMLPEVLERGTMVFYRDRMGKPVLRAYQIKGFLKYVAGIYNGEFLVNGKPLKALADKMEKTVFITPWYIPLIIPEGGEIDYCERPLRGQTAMGERVTVVRSEMLPEKTRFVFHIEMLTDKIPVEVLKRILDYAIHKGLGGWRGAGYGELWYEMEEESGEN